MESIGYARRYGRVGDVERISARYVEGTLLKTRKKFRWRLGLGKVELIQFGTFNENPDYQKGGKVLKVC